MGAFLGAVLGGANPTLGGDINQSGQVADFATSVGEGDVSAASDFDKALLSGNQAKEAALLAPEISGIQKRGQQQIQTAAQFGNRGGGTNASAQNNIDTQRASVDDMIAKLTGKAASDVGSLGASSLNTGLAANKQQADQSQQQLENFQNSVLGKGISDVAATGLNAAEAGLGF